MKVDTKIELYDGKIDTIEQASKKAFELTVDAVLIDIKEGAVVPHDVGTLEDSAFTEMISDIVAQVVFDTPYARKLYWHPEYNFRTDMNPNAQGLWMQTYIDGDKKDFVADTFVRHFRELSKGLIR